MNKITIYPTRSMFHTNDNLVFTVESKEMNKTVSSEIKLYHLNKVLFYETVNLQFESGKAKLALPMDLQEGSYGILINIDELSCMTAFEVEDDWKKRPRYGFLSEFDSSKLDDYSFQETFLKLHINVVQYYDWMYQHNDLIAPTDEFTDLMGRKLNQKVVRDRIKVCKDLNIKNIAYGAIYGASNQYYEAHKEDAFYNANNEPIKFIDVFTIMNFIEGSNWRNHLINEYKKAIDIMDFDGIHMDTYGYPKVAKSYDGDVIRLDDHFSKLINDTKVYLSEKSKSSELIFNNVGAWPVEKTYMSNQSALYIEVWDPMSTYNHLIDLVRHVKTLTKEKELIISAYLKPYYENESKEAIVSHKLLMSVLFSVGAFHLIMGENKNTLRTGYYCDHGTLNENEFVEIMKYYDFNAMYSEILYDRTLQDISLTHMHGDNQEYIFYDERVSPTPTAGEILAIIKENDKRRVIHLINLFDSNDTLWNTTHKERTKIDNIKIDILALREVSTIYMASPDNGVLPINLEYTKKNTDRGEVVSVNVRDLNVWSMVVIEYK